MLLVGWFVWKWLPSDEKAIQSTVTRLMETASIEPNESGFSRLTYADRVAAFFTTNASLSLEGLGRNFPVLNGRSEVIQASMSARANLRQAKFELADLHVTFPGETGVAEAYAAVRGQVNFETNLFGQAFRLTLRKVNGRWLIDRLTTVERP